MYKLTHSPASDMFCALFSVRFGFHLIILQLKFIIVVVAGVLDKIRFSAFPNGTPIYYLASRTTEFSIVYISIFMYVMLKFPISVLVVFAFECARTLSFHLRFDFGARGFVVECSVLFYSSRFWTQNAHKYPRCFIFGLCDFILFRLGFVAVIHHWSDATFFHRLIVQLVWRVEWAHLQGYIHSNKCSDVQKYCLVSAKRNICVASLRTQMSTFTGQ